MIKNNSSKVKFLSLLLVCLMATSLLSIGVLADNDPKPTSGTTAQTKESSTPSLTRDPELTKVPDSSQNSESSSEPGKDTSKDSSSGTKKPVAMLASFRFDKNYATDKKLTDYKKNYIDGDNFDPDGIVIDIFYDNETKKTVVLKDYGNYSPKTLKTGDTAVIVNVENSIPVEIPVKVEKRIVDSIELAAVSGSFKKSYLEGETFDPAGITIKVKYNDGTHENVDAKELKELTFAPAGPLTKDVTSVELSYEGKKFTLPGIKVEPIKSIEVKTSSGSMVFGQYQILDKSKITVTAVYANNKKLEIKDFDVTNSDFSKAGKGTITIECFGLKKTVDVTVAALEGITVSKNPTKVNYNEGETFNPEGIEVSGKYNGIENRPITGYKVETPVLEPNADGEYVVLVKFETFFEDRITVKVSPISKLIVSTSPTKKNYYEGEAIDITGIKVDVEFANGQKLSDFKGFSLSPESTYANAAAKPVLVYKSVTVELDVTIKPIIAIGVDTSKSTHRDLYTEGEVFDPTGIYIIAQFEDGTFRPIETGACTFSTDKLEKTDKTVKVTYKNFKCEVEVKVTGKVVMVAMTPKKLPKTDYFSGEKLTLEGLELIITFSDGTRKTLKVNEVVSQPAEGSELKAGVDTFISFVYTDAENNSITCDVPINVRDKAITVLDIEKKPDKLTYTEGEKFDPTGMVVKAYYDDSTYAEITDYVFTETPFVLSTGTATKISVIVSAGGIEKEILVDVKPAQISSITVKNPPEKVNYKVGEVFSPEGMEVTVVFANGKTATVPLEYCTFSQNGAFTADSKEAIIVTFREKTAAVTITLDKSDVTSGTNTDTDAVTTTSTPDSNTESNPVDSSSDSGSESETEEQKKGKISGGLLALFIGLIVFVVALIVVLIIYYRKHFC